MLQHPFVRETQTEKEYRIAVQTAPKGTPLGWVCSRLDLQLGRVDVPEATPRKTPRVIAAE